MGEPEELSSSGALSLERYTSILSGNIDMTLADNAESGVLKLISTQSGASVEITCSISQVGGPWTGFTLGANAKSLLGWSDRLGLWMILDMKGLTKVNNP